MAALLSTGCELAYDEEYDEDYVEEAGDTEVVFANHDKVTICHFPPGDATQERYRTIRVAETAVQDHLDHGDLIGDCDVVVCDDWFCAGS